MTTVLRRGLTSKSAAVSRRAMLYIPGSSQKMLQKATTLRVDSVCMDCEDGVALNAKASARANIVEALAGLKFQEGTERLVRINPINTQLGEDDLKAVLS